MLWRHNTLPRASGRWYRSPYSCLTILYSSWCCVYLCGVGRAHRRSKVESKDNYIASYTFLNNFYEHAFKYLHCSLALFASHLPSLSFIIFPLSLSFSFSLVLLPIPQMSFFAPPLCISFSLFASRCLLVSFLTHFNFCSSFLAFIQVHSSYHFPNLSTPVPLTHLTRYLNE